MTASNIEIREHATEKGIKLWQIAGELSINDGNFSRKLRYELPENEKKRIIGIIDSIAEREEQN